MVMKNEQIELSPAEIEMVRIIREQELLAKQEADTKKKIADEKAIDKCKAEISSFLHGMSLQNKAAYDFWFALNEKYPGIYSIKDENKTKRHEAYDYISIYDKDGRFVDSNKEILFEEYTPYNNRSIIRTDSDDKILVELHTTGDRFRRNSSYQMFINYSTNRAYKNVATVHDKIQGKINSKKRQQSDEEISQEGWEMLYNELKLNNPDAVDISKKEEYVSYNNRGRGPAGCYSRKIYVTFANGLIIGFSFKYFKNMEGKMEFSKYISVINHSKIDNEKVINALKSI